MKKTLLLATCIIALGATSAWADLISVDTARSSYDAYDKLVISIGEFDGVSSSSLISAFEGEFTATSTEGIRLSSSTDTSGTAAWYKYTLNNFAGIMETLGTSSDYFSSYANLDSTTGGLSDGSDLSRAGSDATHMYTSFTGSWFTTEPSSFLGESDVIAVLYVLPGTNVSFSGAAYVAGDKEYGISFSTAVPEPSTLVLLACGLFGLLAYAWRKRR